VGACRFQLAVLVALLACAAGLSADPAAGSRPAKGAQYYGFDGGNMTTGDPGTTSALRVGRSGRRFTRAGRGSYVDVSIDCKADRSGTLDGKVRLASRRRQVRISRAGRFGLVARQGRLRVRLRGRFVAPDEAKIVYAARGRPARPRRGRRHSVCKGRGLVTLYRNGQPPFRGCRVQPAKTLERTSAGRIFEQLRLDADGGFFTNYYACLFESNKRVRLGKDTALERVDVPLLAPPLVGFSGAGCSIGGCSSKITIKNLRSGKRVGGGPALCDMPASGSPADQPNLVQALVLKPNGANAWIVSTNPIPGSPPEEKGYIQVCADDAGGRRHLDVGDGIRLKSLKLSGSTLTWVKDGAARTATLN
jgi:hypothetical protein